MLLALSQFYEIWPIFSWTIFKITYIKLVFTFMYSDVPLTGEFTLAHCICCLSKSQWPLIKLYLNDIIKCVHPVMTNLDKYK